MIKTKTAKVLVPYGYIIEFVVAALVFVALWQLGWLASVRRFTDDSAVSWATVFGMMFAGAMAARLVFFNLNSGDFGAWLEWKGLNGLFSCGFLFNVLLFLILTVTNVVIVYVKGTWLTYFGVFMGVLGLINSVTFPFLIYQLSRLQAVFNLEFKKAVATEKQTK